MGQILHGSATTTHAIRAAIQRSKAPLKELAAQYGLNQKTVAKWRKRAFVHDAPMGPKTVRSIVLSVRLRRDDEDRRGRQRAARRDPGAMAGAGDAPPEIRLP